MGSNSKEMVEDPQADELVIDDAIYHSLYNAMSVGIQICNLLFDEKGKPNDFIFLAVNPAYEKQTGFRAEQVIGKRATEFMPYADTLWFDLAEEAINSQKATSGEVYNQPLDRWFKIFASPLPGNNLFALFFEDITEHKKAEEILSKAKDDMSAILENINMGIMSLDNNWRFKYVNNKAVEGIGRKPEDLVGKDLRQEFPWLTTLKAVGLFQKVMDNRTIVSIEERGAISDRYYKHTICPIPDGIFLFWEDITERKQMEKALKESEERHAFLLKLSNMLRTVSDPLEIYESAVRVVMEQFHTDRCYFTELKEGEAVIHRESKREGLPPILGGYDIKKLPVFHATIDTGVPLVVADARTSDLLDSRLKHRCIQLNAISFIDAPVIRNGRAVGILNIVHNESREWTELEVELAEEAAERIWSAVERARS